MTTIEQKSIQLSNLDRALFKVYDSPASITVVTGKWKKGKTDFALRLAKDELYDRLGIIKEIGSNIETECQEIRYINNFTDFEVWLFGDRNRKAFIYDEAIKSTPSRKAMSQINTKWLEYVPELSKGRCHLIVVTQEEDYTEKLFLHPTFVRAKWVKQDLKIADLIITGEPQIQRFYNIPKTTVPFDPYRIAIWKMESEDLINIEDVDIKILWDYAQISSDEIIKKYPFLNTRKDVTIHLKRGIKKIQNLLYSVMKRSGGNIPLEDYTTQ
jgi:formyltetrahydrofolate hydrolase